MTVPSREDLLAARARLRDRVHLTPVMSSSFLDGLTGHRLSFKCENFQKIGAFKFRGASNAVAQLSLEQRRRGVITHSSGNHAQALALAAAQHSVAATVVMPNNSAAVKVAAVRGYGAQVELSAPNVAAREQLVDVLMATTGATLIHPYDNDHVIAGQATAAAELFEQVDGPLDFLLAPVSGGGLLSGIALAAAYFSPRTKVIGVEPAGADDAYRSFRSGKLEVNAKVETIADGLRSQLCERTLAIVRHHVRDIIRVEEATIIKAMHLVLERMKILIEPSAAVAVAGLLEDNNYPPGARIGVILSGGNVDLDSLPWLS